MSARGVRRLALLMAAALIIIVNHGGMDVAGQGEAGIRVDVVPTKAFFRPGEAAQFEVIASVGARVEATITHLTATVAQVSAALDGGRAVLVWEPPGVAPRGYGLTVRALDAEGRMLGTASTAFDVLERWTQAPRYGFLSQFQPGRTDAAETAAWATRFHLNGLQFYDWQYRHEHLLPPTEEYADVLGRSLSMTVVRALIEAAQARNIAAMPYTAIYGASVAFYREHPDWALFQFGNVPYTFGDNFLIIMDPSRGSPWAMHLLDEYARVLDETAFDGIHIDQYGAPKIGRSASGARVDLAQVFPEFINDAAMVVRSRRGAAGATIFNAVGNWPVETVAAADQDAVYIEVWQPYVYYLDLARLVSEAQRLGGGKPVIIAAYIHPRAAHNVRLANAMIFASGGYHLELGEPGAMLADPYFPQYGMMDATLQTVMRRYYDFLVRYAERLSLGTAAADSRAADLTIDGVETTGLRSRDRVAVLVRAGEGFETFSLVNLMGLAGGQWNVPLDEGPTPLNDLSVRVRVDQPVARAWLATPDGMAGADDTAIGAQAVRFTTERDAAGMYIALQVPQLAYWTMLVLEYGS
jgi:dextranase